MDAMSGGAPVIRSPRQRAPGSATGAGWQLSATDLHLFNEGTHRGLADKLGAHPLGEAGTAFAVWAPNARAVSVIGDFNGWDAAAHPLAPRGLIGHLGGRGRRRRPRATSTSTRSPPRAGAVLEKADPFACAAGVPAADRIGRVGPRLRLGRRRWMATRGRRSALDAPISVYEVHLGSWRRAAGRARPASRLRASSPRCSSSTSSDRGFTHVEFLPVMEHPFYGSLGLPDHAATSRRRAATARRRT